LCKLQVIVLLTCIDLTKENIIKYCGTWYGTNCDGFKAMFAYPTYFQSLAMVIWKMKITRTMVKRLMSLRLGGLIAMDDHGSMCMRLSQIVNQKVICPHGVRLILITKYNG
jgi:hypothetical protein